MIERVCDPAVVVCLPVATLDSHRDQLPRKTESAKITHDAMEGNRGCDPHGPLSEKMDTSHMYFDRCDKILSSPGQGPLHIRPRPSAES